jgi:hypothetical protein
MGFKALGAFIDTQKVKILDNSEFHMLDSEIPRDQREKRYGGLLPDLKTFFPPNDSYHNAEKLTLKKMADDRKIVPFFFSVKKYVDFLHLSNRDAPIPSHAVPNDHIYEDFGRLGASSVPGSLISVPKVDYLSLNNPAAMPMGNTIYGGQSHSVVQSSVHNSSIHVLSSSEAWNRQSAGHMDISNSFVNHQNNRSYGDKLNDHMSIGNSSHYQQHPNPGYLHSHVVF